MVIQRRDAMTFSLCEDSAPQRDTSIGFLSNTPQDTTDLTLVSMTGGCYFWTETDMKQQEMTV